MEPTPAPTPPQSSQRQPTDNVADADETVYPTPPQNAGSAPFYVLTNLFDKLQTERKPEKRRRLIESWFRHWRNEKGFDLYPVLRLILPQKDRERAVYGLKEANLAKTYIKLIPLGRRDPDALRLMNWKKPSDSDKEADQKSAGDFPTVLYEVVSKRSSVMEGTLSIDDINEVLDDLSKAIGKQEAQAHVLQRIYNNTTPEEQRWLVRIILKSLIISVKETTVFAAFHPDAQDLFNTCSDLKKVAWELWDPDRRLNEEDKSIQLFRPFAPMLCKRPTRRIEETVKEMQGRAFIIEEKLDGERMQLHKRGNEYFYCSRKGKDYTYLYGKHVGIGSLTPFIDTAFDPRIDSIILDGEMLVWDPVSERNLPFGTLKTAALDKTKKDHNPRPCFKVFDLLHLNGQSLLTRSVTFRKKNMRAYIKEIKGRIEFATSYNGRTARDVRERMDEVMATRGEGLVIKHPDAEYVLNGRNKDWIKVKPEYMDNMGETVDVLVVAGNYGTGRRGGGVSTLVCAVLDDRQPVDDEDDNRYNTFVRIGSGFSYADFIWIREKPWKKWDPKDPPAFLQTSSKGNEDKGDVYLEPEDSFIVKVKAAEITKSDQYHLGFTMRFPRALSIRDDLTIADCMTATAVLEAVREERKRKMETNDTAPKKKRKATSKAKITLLPEFQGTKLKDLPVQDNLFEDMKFMVSSDPKSKTGTDDKTALLKLIHMHGGAYAQVAKQHSELIVVYGGTTTPYDIKLIMNKGVHDIIKPQWIYDSISAGERVPMTKKYFFHATEARQQELEYQDEEDEEEDEDATMEDDTVPGAVAADDEQDQKPDISEVPEPQSEVKMDPELAEWFKVGENDAASPAQQPDESETEPESGADDGDDDEGGGLRSWFDVKPDLSQIKGEGDEDFEMVRPTSSQGNQRSEAPVKMGESDTAMQYDENMIFRHLCFYLDTPANAKTNKLALNTKHEAAITEKFEKITKFITENGGRIVDLTEPKLTHIILDKRDTARRIKLMQMTSKPKRRNMVLSDFIEACIDEDTLLPEEDFAP